ncbi:hypothetical protein FN846DRAFT_897053 [Sphaerosporella brunnea]|uniref:Protein phosphatase n=1 Tax=Sphaerosporella brunnea TaxID=1250544 RepID=A0A5J5F974_9PEZI|nr:hypothetical protein FN846DRAFT_897053 [Sphaerosporella brunnea]
MRLHVCPRLFRPATITIYTPIRRASEQHYRPTRSSPAAFPFVPSYALFAKRPPRPFTPSRGRVGAWNTRAHGHAALWSRLVLHFWGKELLAGQWGGVDPTTIYATTNAGARGDQVWQGTTTVCGAVLTDRKLVVLNLGDSVAIVWRKGLKKWWHWFDCPTQLGTNSSDTPVDNAVVQEVEVQNGDLVLLATDGLVDNMWDAEIMTVIMGVMEVEEEEEVVEEVGEGWDQGRMKMLSQRILQAAKKTAIDPFAESPYMERSIEMGLVIIPTARPTSASLSSPPRE